MYILDISRGDLMGVTLEFHCIIIMVNPISHGGLESTPATDFCIFGTLAVELEG